MLANELPPLAQPRLQLLPPPRTSPLALWHLLSLDAPTVAALWTVFLAHCAGVALPWTAPVAMFLAVWMLYAADRLLDARSSTDLEARHHFHHRHRKAFLSLITLSAIVLIFLLLHIDEQALKLYVLLATLLAVWLLLVHAHPSASTLRLPKELAVGIFFSAAVFIPTVARAPQLRPALVPSATLLAAVCILNCLFIYAWEHPAARLKAHWTTRWATQHLMHLGATVAVLSIFTALTQPTSLRPPAIACTISALLLLLLHAGRNRITTLHLRAAADLALLSPILLLPLVRW